MGYQNEETPSNTLNVSYAHADAAFWLAPSLREADLEELRVAHCNFDGDPGNLLYDSLREGDKVFQICHGDTIHALWGYGEWPTDEDEVEGIEGAEEVNPLAPQAYVWLVGTDDLFSRHAFLMTRRFRKDILPELLNVYSSVGNYVMMSNHVHRDWLKAVGFSEVDYININGEEFVLMVASLV